MRQRELVPVPSGLDAAEAVSLVLNYITAYQMTHRSVHVRPGQRALIHGEESEVSGRDNLQTVAILEACVRSAAEARPINPQELLVAG